MILIKINSKHIKHEPRESFHSNRAANEVLPTRLNLGCNEAIITTSQV